MNADLFQRSHDYAPMLGPLEDWPAGSPEWAERLSFRIKISVENIAEQGIDRLLPWIELAFNTEPRPWKIWPTGEPCLLPDKYFRYAADIGCGDLAKLIAAYKGESYSLVRALRAAIGEGEQVIADEVNKGGRGKHRRDSTVFARGNRTSYLLRRLSRERPDILAAYERAEFKTPTAAARAAGFKVDTPPLTKLRRAWRRANKAERDTFRAEIAD